MYYTVSQLISYLNQPGSRNMVFIDNRYIFASDLKTLQEVGIKSVKLIKVTAVCSLHFTLNRAIR